MNVPGTECWKGVWSKSTAKPHSFPKKFTSPPGFALVSDRCYTIVIAQWPLFFFSTHCTVRLRSTLPFTFFHSISPHCIRIKKRRAHPEPEARKCEISQAKAMWCRCHSQTFRMSLPACRRWMKNGYKWKCCLHNHLRQHHHHHHQQHQRYRWSDDLCCWRLLIELFQPLNRWC